MDGNMATIPYIVWEAEKEYETQKHRRDLALKIGLILLALVNSLAWLFVRKKENGTQ